MKEDELKKYNGKNGEKAYVAYQGKIYDVTDSSFWKDGEHQDMHIAGSDLTSSMESAPHKEEVFASFKVVDTLEKSPQKSSKEETHPLKTRLKEWYKIYHPHPITVHFPIALHIFAGLFNVLFLFDKNEVYGQMVFYSFSIATVMGAVAMVFGILSWWINYNLYQGKSFIIKLYTSVLTLILGAIGIAIYTYSKSSVYEMDFLGIVYHLSIFATVATVVILGYYGGKITWGDPRTKLKPSPKALSDEATHRQKVASKLPEIPSTKEVFDIEPYIKEDAIFETETHFKEINIQIAGPAGAGLNALATLISKTLKKEKLYHFITSEYMSRVRGGMSTTFIRVAEEPVEAAKWESDIAIILDKDAYTHIAKRAQNAFVVGDSSFKIDHKNFLPLDVKNRIKDIGKIYTNSYLFGSLIAMLNLAFESGESAIKEVFKDKKLEENLEAFQKGFEDSESKSDIAGFTRGLKDNEGFLNGTEASGVGFISGGVNFVSSYPMSPSTGVLSFMSKQASKFGTVVEQAEDEIAGFNMMLGAWYAGGRGLTTTSGGGFALMSEGMSLSGMSETPALIYLAQRPGPATGLPTRTEQGDLNLALYAGHGEFAKALLAPGDSDEALKLAHLSANLADFFQIPVVYMSDQFFSDSIRVSKELDFDKLEFANYIQKSKSDYKRYKIEKSGITPRAVPGFGDALVVCTSDEHDERGQITEDYEVREAMVEKRAKKLQKLREFALAPKIYKRDTIAIIGWGSTKGVLKEVCNKLNLTHIHFSWIYPLNHTHLEKIKEFTKLIVVENNQEGQFAQLLEKEGLEIDQKVVSSNGFAFFADSLEKRLQECTKEMK